MANASGYPNDSPGKKISRATFWVNSLALMTHLQVPYRGSLVLTGEGGDIWTLDGFGIPRESISAVDVSDEWFETLSEMFPGTNFLHGEAGRLAKKAPYNLANLDFCNGLTADNIETLVRVASNADTLPCIIGVSSLRSRIHQNQKKPLTVKMPLRSRKQLLEYRESNGVYCGNQMLLSDPFDPGLAIKRAESWLTHVAYERFPKGVRRKLVTPSGKQTPIGNGIARVHAMVSCARVHLAQKDIELSALSTICYHSRSNATNGSAFVHGLILAYASRHKDYVASRLSEYDGLVPYLEIPAAQGEDKLRELALALSDKMPTGRVADILNIRTGTVAAWKAHRTMGTYDHLSVPDTIGETPPSKLLKNEYGYGLF